MKNEEECNSLLMKKFIKDSMEFDKGIQAIARKLSNGDRFLAEELRSEMHIAILNMQEGQNKGYYFRAAKNKAIDYLRSRARNYSYAAVIKHISLDAMTEAGFQVDSDGKIYTPENFSAVDMGLF
jgi:DNA-directed RNA polymerase specialized sigma24 family protein